MFLSSFQNYVYKMLYKLQVCVAELTQKCLFYCSKLHTNLYFECTCTYFRVMKCPLSRFPHCLKFLVLKINIYLEFEYKHIFLCLCQLVIS
jgi:hypothetical protein